VIHIRQKPGPGIAERVRVVKSQLGNGRVPVGVRDTRSSAGQVVDAGLDQHQVRAVQIAHLFVVAVVAYDRDVEELVEAAHMLLNVNQQEWRKPSVVPVLEE
jgi:hypothetical protein